MVVVALVAAGGVQAETLQLHSGETLVVEIVAQDDVALTVKHRLFGEQVIPRSEIAVILADEAAAEEPGLAPVEPATVVEATVGEQPPPPAPTKWNPTLFGVDFFKGWERELEFGVEFERGSTDKDKVKTAFSAADIGEILENRVYARYRGETSNGNQTKNEARISYDRVIKKPDDRWFRWGYGEWDWDEFKERDHRLLYQAGLGYILIEPEESGRDLELRVRGGLGGRTVFVESDVETSPEAVMGVAVAWGISDRQDLSFSNVFNPDLSDGGVFRNTTEAAWTVQVEDNANYYIKFSLENEYDTDPEGGDDRNELKILSSLLWKF